MPKSKHRSHRGKPTRSRAEKKQKKYREIVTLQGFVQKNPKGFAFIIFDDNAYEDAYVPATQATNLFPGDRVELKINSAGEVLGLKILEHRYREIVGKFLPREGGGPEGAKGGYVLFERKKVREQIYLPEGAPGAKTGDWVRAQMVFPKNPTKPITARTDEVFGSDLPAEADLRMIAAEFGLNEEHSVEAKNEALAFRFSPDLHDRRKDLRDLPLITIDGEDARDFDDAVYVEKKGAEYVLWVAIADVSFYVTEGSAIDRDAFARATSVYFPERAFHMLPRALSENLCSLKPNEDRLAFVCEMRFNGKGDRVGESIYEAVIRSKRRATYTEIQNEANKRGPNWEYAPHFALYEILRRKRTERGSIDFDLPEAKVKTDATGEPVAIVITERKDAHRLIEEFMIAANEAVTEWMLKRKHPFVYRVHEAPDSEKLEKFQRLAATVGLKLQLKDNPSPKALSALVEQIESHPARYMLNMTLLRSLKQARYRGFHDMHFGLASKAYTHFTSPIRRYPDLLVHRLLKQALGVRKYRKTEEELDGLAMHCSYRERLADDAERESVKLKQVRLMRKHLGSVFKGQITGLSERGLFVQIDEPYVEGMIPQDQLPPDHYTFDEEKMIMSGRRTKRIFKIGQAVSVQVLRADMERRQIDFGLEESAPSRQKTPN